MHFVKGTQREGHFQGTLELIGAYRKEYYLLAKEVVYLLRFRAKSSLPALDLEAERLQKLVARYRHTTTLSKQQGEGGVCAPSCSAGRGVDA